jgi:hypothetical protein
MLYFLILGLQVLCVWHVIKTKNQLWWIWFVIFVPVIGCSVYLLAEIFNKQDVQQVQEKVNSIINPSKKIQALQDRLAFSETFENKLALAKAYQDAKFTDEAINLYESAATGVFKDNPEVHKNLVTCYYEKRKFGEVIKSAEKINTEKYFKNSSEQLLYALSLDELQFTEKASVEFVSMNVQYKNYNQRLHYARFLKRHNENEKAKLIYQNIIDESLHLGKPEYKKYRPIILDAMAEVESC